MKMTNERLFYLFVLGQNTFLNNDKKLIISMIGDYFNIYNLDSKFIYFNNMNRISISPKFRTKIKEFIKNELIYFNQQEVYLTKKGLDILKDKNINSIEDIDNLLFDKNLQTKETTLFDENSKEFYFLVNTLAILKSFKRWVRKRNITTQSSYDNKYIKELLYKGILKMKYRNNNIDLENKHEFVKKLEYPALVLGYNREEEYFQLTEYGEIKTKELGIK